MNNKLDTGTAYTSVLQKIITEIGSTKITVARVVNTELTQLYWTIGKIISEKQRKQGWGKSVIEKLAADIAKNTGYVKGFSPRNLWFMKQFFEEYNDKEFLKQLVSELKLKQPVSVLKQGSSVLGLLPWGHHILLMQKTQKDKERVYYITTAITTGWSRQVLMNQIKANAYSRQMLLPKQHNFQLTLPVHLQDQANEMLKSNYNLEFLGISKPVQERDFENRLLEKLKEFILELGYGFSFIGNQYRLELNKKEYFVDLLFFQRRLRCLVAIDLKIGSFEPEFAGKMNFYLNLLDDTGRMPEENPSIGIILCEWVRDQGVLDAAGEMGIVFEQTNIQSGNKYVKTS